MKIAQRFSPGGLIARLQYTREAQRTRRFAPHAALPPVKAPPLEYFKDMLQGSGENEFSTTMAFVGILKKLMQHKELGKWVVPIIPDEARTFGMDAFFKTFGIYSNVGQLYEPVDAKTLLAYREAKNGQVLEEGITEAGAMSSFIAAGTAYATQGIPTIPFFIYYSMFGFQRIGDQIWLAADSRTRGFLVGGTAGRTTLAGEGLQHQDGHSHLAASTVPNVIAYDPTYAYELTVTYRTAFAACANLTSSMTVGNEQRDPPLPELEKDIFKVYKLHQPLPNQMPSSRRSLFGSGTILRKRCADFGQDMAYLPMSECDRCGASPRCTGGGLLDHVASDRRAARSCLEKVSKASKD